MNKIKSFLNKLFNFLDTSKNLNVLKRIGLLTSLISLVLIFFEFDNLEFNTVDVSKNSYIISVFFMMISYTFFGINWAEFLFENLKLNRKNSFIFWSYSNLGKYIPGFVGIPLLRVSQSSKVKSKLLFSGMLQEQLIPILILIPTTLVILLLNLKTNYLIIFCIVLFLFLRIFKFIFIKYKLFEINKSYITKTFILLAGFSFQYISILYICREVIPDMPHQLALLYTLSAALSLIFIGSPSGIGIREFLLFQLTKNTFLDQTLFTVMISLRVVYFAVDIITGIGGLLFSSTSKKK